MGKIHRMLWLATAAVLLVGGGAGKGQQAGHREVPAFRPTSKVVLYLDTSGSMAGKRAQAMGEAAKLFLATLDQNQEVIIVPFSHVAKMHRFSLATLAERQTAMTFIDDLVVDGGTDYLAALKVAKVPAGTPGIFLSDGEHNGEPGPVLALLKMRKAAPLFTVAVEAPAGADKLLSEMAALTGGSHVRVENSEELVKTFLEIAKHLGNYRSYTPKDAKVECQGVIGKLIAFGFDAVPKLTTQPLSGPVLNHQASLPGEHVHLSAVDLAKPSLVTIEATQKRSANGRLAAILRQDLLRSVMKVHAPGGKAGAGSDLKVTTQFFDRQGRVVDPRKRADLSSVYYLLDQTGKVLQRILAKPSSAEPALEATIPLPKTAGPITVRNITQDASQGPAFEAEQNRTIVLQKPIPLTVQPDKIALTVTEGSFTTSLTVKAQHDPFLAAIFSASLEGTKPELKLQESRSLKETLELDLEAPVGTYKGTLIIHGTATLPLESVRIPIEVIVKERSRGLALPAKRTVRLGPVLANSGRKDLATLEFPSLDVDEVPYIVDVEDLSNDAAVIPCQADHTRITPCKTKPTAIALTAEIGNVPAGTYTASVLVRSTVGGARLWRTTLTLLVTEPLAASPLDFGTIEVGKAAKRTLVIKNAAEALADIRLVKADIAGQGGEIVVTLPDKIDVAARQNKEVAVTVTLSPLLESRGVHKGTLVLRRTANQDIKIPLQIDVVGAGEGPRTLLVAPAKVHVQGRPGEVHEFAVRTKFSVAAEAATEELTAEASAFKDDNGKPINLEVAFKWAPGTKLTRAAPVTVQGFLVIPDRRGTFTATLTIRSANSGSVLIPLTLVVR